MWSGAMTLFSERAGGLPFRLALGERAAVPEGGRELSGAGAEEEACSAPPVGEAGGDEGFALRDVDVEPGVVTGPAACRAVDGDAGGGWGAADGCRAIWTGA